MGAGGFCLSSGFHSNRSLQPPRQGNLGVQHSHQGEGLSLARSLEVLLVSDMNLEGPLRGKEAAWGGAEALAGQLVPAAVCTRDHSPVSEGPWDQPEPRTGGEAMASWVLTFPRERTGHEPR